MLIEAAEALAELAASDGSEARPHRRALGVNRSEKIDEALAPRSTTIVRA
jgi:hypothetical protein